MPAFLFMVCAIAGLCIMFGLVGLVVVFAVQIGRHAVTRRRKL